MSRMLTVVALSAAVLASAACTNRYQDEASSAQPRGTAFDTALSRDYLSLAKVEYASNDQKDGDAYARRSLAAGQGKPTQPDEPKLRDYLPSDKEGELNQARQRLTAALDKNNRNARPQVAARAQALYDCWLEQSEEDLQPDHIKACRDGFMTALAEIEKPIAAPAPPPAPKAAVPDRYLVFFDWNKAILTAEARRVLADAARVFKEQGRATILATGYTDRSGSEAYNQRLSERRANAVKTELVRLGVPATAITTIGRGESNPLVPTADGVREPQNRRVEIQLQKTGS
jgi:OmpA-OmpF porin, OOP family